MSTGLQGEVERIEDDEATSLPVTRFCGKFLLALWQTWRGWRALPTDDKEE